MRMLTVCALLLLLSTTLPIAAADPDVEEAAAALIFPFVVGIDDGGPCVIIYAPGSDPPAKLSPNCAP